MHLQPTPTSATLLRKPEGTDPSLFQLAPVKARKILRLQSSSLCPGCKTIWVGWVDKKPEEEAGVVFFNPFFAPRSFFLPVGGPCAGQELQDFFKDCGKIVEAAFAGRTRSVNESMARSLFRLPLLVATKGLQVMVHTLFVHAQVRCSERHVRGYFAHVQFGAW